MCLCACNLSESFEGMHEQSELVLRLSLESLTRTANETNTRAGGTPLLELNENKVSSLEIFLYANNATDNTPAVYATRVENLDKSGSFSLVLSVPQSVVESLFSNGVNTCKIYAIANYATGLTESLDHTSVAELKGMPVEATFSNTYNIDLSSFSTDDKRYGVVKSCEPQPLFVMDSEVSTVTKSDNKLTGSVTLNRAASKITFRTTIAQEVVINGKIWEPVLDNLTFTYHNMVNRGFVDNDSDVDNNNTFTMPVGEGVYVDVEDLHMSTILSDNGAVAPDYGSEVEGASNWVTLDHITPLYTYSSRWSDGADNEAHITLTVPWRVKGDNSTTLTYYSYFVPLNMNDYKLVRNKHYRINLRVGVIGDIVIDQINETIFSYEVVDWVGQNIEADLQKPLYLMVESNYVELYNETSASVAFQASGDVVFNSNRTTIPYNNSYSDVTSTTIKSWQRTTVDGKEVISAGCTYTNYQITIANGEITFTHEQDNVMTATKNDMCDFLPQTTVVRIYLKENKNIYQDITFVQYPAMHVNTYVYPNGKTTHNYVNVNGNSSWSNSGGAGNGCPRYNNATVYWVGIGGKNPNNLNPNIYEIVVSAFDSTTSQYLIADPRGPAQDITTFPGYNHDTEDTNRTSTSPAYPVQKDQLNVSEIKGYRGTLTGADAANLIAPEFIIASFMSTCTRADRYLYAEDSAWNRCAGYQEAGYPAGRWRIPTAAELEFVGRLCAKEMLPQIFTDDQSYPSSSGNYLYEASDGSFSPTTKAATSVRCVYDTWYWRDKCNDTSMQKLLWAADGNVQDMKNNNTYDTYLQLVE